MTMQTALKTYLSAIEQALATGQASEHTHRPALESLLEVAGGTDVDAINEPRQISCGAPDFIVVRGTVPLGHVEAKDVGSDLNRIERSEQLLRYRESLANLVLTDYLSFRWYLDGELRLTADLPRPGANGKIRWIDDAASQVAQLLQQFLIADILCGAGAIVTYNLKDFPASALALYGVSAQHPDEFIEQAFDLDSGAVCTAVRNQRRSLKNPPKSVDELFDTYLRAELVATVQALKPHAALL